MDDGLGEHSEGYGFGCLAGFIILGISYWLTASIKTDWVRCLVILGIVIVVESIIMFPVFYLIERRKQIEKDMKDTNRNNG